MCYFKGRSLRCSPGQGNAGCCTVMLYMGEGPRGSNGARSTLCHPQSNWGPFWCWFPSGWACAHSRPLWVSSTNSPLRLGVSAAAASTPTGVFNQRFEALFSCPGTLGCAVYLAPQLFLPVYLHVNMGPPPLLAAALLDSVL